MNIAILGAGKVGQTLARSLRRTGHRAALRPLRDGLPRRPYSVPLLVLAVRDGDIPRVAQRLADAALVSRKTTVLHVAGALGPAALDPLRGVAAGVGRAHPLLSFATPDLPTDLTGGLLLIAGDPVAIRHGRSLGRALGMIARQWTVDPLLYHAAAGLLANGAAALAAAAAELLARGGAPAEEIPSALGPLLASVATNVGRVGLPDALTGPVRRGDAATVEKHIRAIRAVDPPLAKLYGALVVAQLPLARALGDAQPTDHDATEQAVRRALRARRK